DSEHPCSGGRSTRQRHGPRRRRGPVHLGTRRSRIPELHVRIGWWCMAANAPEAVPTPAPEVMPDELDSKHLIRRLAALVVLVALVVVAVSSLPGLGTLRNRFAQADLALLGLIGLLKLASCLSNVVAFRYVFCPRMSWRFSAQLSLAEQATNVLVPTGGAGGVGPRARGFGQGRGGRTCPRCLGFAPGRDVERTYRSPKRLVLRAHQRPELRGRRCTRAAAADGLVLRSYPDRPHARPVSSRVECGGSDRAAAAVARSGQSSQDR